MRTRHALFGVSFVLPLVACSARGEEPAADESGIATSSTRVTCSEVHGTADGRYAVYATCAGSSVGPRIVRTELDGGMFASYESTIAKIAPTDKIFSLGTSGTYVYWGLKHEDGTRDFNLAVVDATPAAVTKMPLGALTEPLDDVVVTDRGLVAFVGETREGGVFGESLFVGRIGQTAPLLVEPLGTGASYFDMMADEDGDSLVLDDHRGSVRFVDLYDDVPRLYPWVTLDTPIFTAVPGSFDGSTFVARARLADGEIGIATVSARTGRVNVLSRGWTLSPTIVTRGAAIWHTSKRKSDAQYVLEYIARAGGTSPRTLATDPDLLRTRLSHDGSALLYRGGRETDANTLGVVASDGATPARKLVGIEENLSVRFDVAGAHGGLAATRAVVVVRDRATRLESVRLVDDTSGNLLGSWTVGDAIGASSDVMLTDDGSALYGAKPCNTTGEGPRGKMFSLLWPSATQVTGCMTAPGDRSTLPNSSVLLLTSGTSPRVVTVLRP